MKPKKRLGQNFLIDKNIQAKIIQACRVTKKDIVLEIGPGRGDLTQLLLEKAKKVIAVEIDKPLCDALLQKFSGYKNFILLHGDILKVDFSKFEKLKVIGNIPYYISTPLIARLLEQRKHCTSLYVSLQKELARRLIAAPHTKSYGAFTCFVQFYSRPQILFCIKPASFWPKPEVDSCFVELKVPLKPKYKVCDEVLLFKIIRSAFTQRRKLLTNSLAELLPARELLHCLSDGKIPQNSRAENLSLGDFIKVTEYVSALKIL